MHRYINFASLLWAAAAQFQGNIQYRVTNEGTITCSLAGFKCGYIQEDFLTAEITGTGQSTVGGFGGIENLVWSPLDVTTDQLILSKCQTDYCLVSCNIGCDCADETGAACATGTFAPTAAPTAADTGPRQCPLEVNTEYCAELSAALPPGNLENFDCFNFCGGAPVDTCSFDGTCGTDLSCANATDGGPLGIVQGCTKEMLMGGGGSGASSVLRLPMAMSAALASVLLAMVI